MKFLDNRGQAQMLALAVTAVVGFVIIAIGMAITLNVNAATGQTPTFSGLWPTVVGGALILAVLIAGFAMRGR